MDIRIAGTNGIDATRQVLDSTSDTRVIILTTFDLDEHVLDALRVGASGFLVKDGPAESLVDAIRTVAAGDAVIAPASPDAFSTDSPHSRWRPRSRHRA